MRLIALLSVLFFFMIIASSGLNWGVNNGKLNIFYPDEYTHAKMAKNYLTRTIEPSSYVRGFSTQIAILSVIFTQKIFLPEDDKFNNIETFVMVGRILSLLYGLVTLLLLFVIAKHFCGFEVALFSTLILSFLDLFVTYSHLSVPTIATTFWFLLSTFLIYLAYKKQEKFYDLFAIISVGVCVSIQFNFVPIIFLLGVFILRNDSLKNKIFILLWSFFILITTFWASSGTQLTYKDISITIFGGLSSNVLTAIPDKEMWMNPILFLIALIAGTSFITTISAIIGGCFFWKDKISKDFWIFIVLPVFVWFGIICLKPNIMPRYAINLLPIIALFSGYFIKKVLIFFGGSDSELEKFNKKKDFC